MADEGKGVSLAILGIVSVIAVVGLVLLFTGATAQVSMPYSKVYGGVNYGENAYLVDRTQGGFPSTAGSPDAIYYETGIYTENPGLALQEEGSGRYGQTLAETRETFQRSEYNTPSGQLCAAGPSTPGFRCPYGTTCISNFDIAESGGWVPAPEHPCYKRESQV